MPEMNQRKSRMERGLEKAFGSKSVLPDTQKRPYKYREEEDETGARRIHYEELPPNPVTEPRHEDEDEELDSETEETRKWLRGLVFEKGMAEAKHLLVGMLKEMNASLEPGKLEQLAASILAETFGPHGGSDRATNMRTPGMGSSIHQAIPAEAGYGHQGSTQSAETRDFTDTRLDRREAGAEHNDRSRGLTPEEAKEITYDSMAHVTSGGTTRPGQASTTYHKRFEPRLIKGKSPQTPTQVEQAMIGSVNAELNTLPRNIDMLTGRHPVVRDDILALGGGKVLKAKKAGSDIRD